MGSEQPETSMARKLMCWLRANWKEDTNVGKAKIAAIPVAIFIVIALLWPTTPPPEAPPVPVQAELVPGIEDLRRQATEAYESYEARIAELSEEKRRELGEAQLQVAEVYRDYERRIADLERENLQLLRQVEALKNTLAARERELASTERSAAAPADAEAAQLQEKLEQVRQELEQLLESLR